MAVINKDYANIKKGTTDLQRLYAGNTLIWEFETPQPQPTDYSTQYLEFVTTSGGTFNFSGSSTANTISYSTDGGNTWSTPATSVTINVNSGDTVMWKGEMTPTSNGVGTYSASTASFDAQGNVMSLLYGNNFINQTDLSGKNFAFRNLFSNTKIVDASNLILPATTLATSCYWYMFIGCTSLTTAPQLLATTLATNCYSSMFWGCTSLTTAPSLPATTLVNGCYREMFRGCTSLTTAPSLPATTLANNCYNTMFYGCTSLTTAPQLQATTLADSCYYSMFYDCRNLNYIKMLATDISASSCLTYWVRHVASSGTFVKAASMTTLPSGESGIPSNWTVQNE